MTPDLSEALVSRAKLAMMAGKGEGDLERPLEEPEAIAPKFPKELPFPRREKGAAVLPFPFPRGMAPAGRGVDFFEDEEEAAALEDDMIHDLSVALEG
jgi:hypothetical protein